MPAADLIRRLAAAPAADLGRQWIPVSGGACISNELDQTRLWWLLGRSTDRMPNDTNCNLPGAGAM